MANRRNLKGTKCVVTGASSGIGWQLSLSLARQGAHVLAVARREMKLTELKHEFQSNVNTRGGEIDVLIGDITKADDRSKIIAWCENNWQRIDLLINNAGSGAIGKFRLAEETRLRQVMEVDFFAPVELTRSALILLSRSSRPAIVVIGSVLAHRGVPLKSEYCAAKFALRGWAEAIRCELISEGIEVLEVDPSTTRTEFFEHLIDSKPTAKSDSWGSMSSRAVADAIVSSIRGSRRRTVVSLGGKLLVWLSHRFPNTFDRILAKRVRKLSDLS